MNDQKPEINQLIFPSYTFPNTGDRLVAGQGEISAIEKNSVTGWFEVYHVSGNLFLEVNPESVQMVAYGVPAPTKQ